MSQDKWMLSKLEKIFNKFYRMVKKDDDTWYETLINMIKEEDESLWYAVSKKLTKMGARLLWTPMTIITDIGDIAVGIYNRQKKKIVLGLLSLASDIYSYGAASLVSIGFLRTIKDEVA